MEKYLEKLNETYKSAKFSIDENGKIIVKVKKINYNASATPAQYDWLSKFCRYKYNGISNLSKAAASAVIGLHKKFPEAKIFITK